MSYWRYKRQFVCADEVGVCLTDADIMVDTGGLLFEVEVKISKSDLIQGEKRKDKHQRYGAITKGSADVKCKYVPNQFYLCVPTSLVEVAKEWVKATNKKYGVLEYIEMSVPWEDRIKVAKKATFIHNYPITADQRNRIVRRLSSARAMTFRDLISKLDSPYESQEYFI